MNTVEIVETHYSYGLTPLGMLLVTAIVLGAVLLTTVIMMLWRGRKKS